MLVDEKMLVLDGFDLSCSYCKRFDGLLTESNRYGTYSGFLCFPKYALDGVDYCLIWVGSR